MSSGAATHYPSIRQAIWLLVVLVLLQIILGIVLGVVDAVFGTSLVTTPAALAVVNVVAIGTVLAMGYRKAKVRRSDVMPLGPVRPALLLPMGLTVLGVFILLSEADNMLRLFLPMPQWLADFFAGLVNTESNVWGSVLLLTIVAPVTEELLFRGLILRGFLSRYGVKKSILVSAVLFALFHLNPWQLMPGMSLGLLLGWWYVRTRSLLPCLLGHALLNSIGLLIMPHLNIPGVSGNMSDAVEFQPLWLDLIGIVFLGCGLVMLVKVFRQTPAPPPMDARADTPSEPQP